MPLGQHTLQSSIWLSTDINEIVASMTRVAPLQSLTIPQLELLSAHLLCVGQSVHGLTSTLCMVLYSQIALCWILVTTKEWKPFVNKRVKKIWTWVGSSKWSHYLGSADLPSGGMTSFELSVSLLRRRGPDWLQCGFDPKTNPRSV